MSKLKGKVALVTGGSRGIGAAIVRRLANDGADVALTYFASPEKARAVAGEVEVLGRRVRAISCDSADPTAVAAAVEQTVSDFGRIDIMVGNAAIFIAKPLHELTFEDFDRMVAINVRAVFAGAQAAARHMTHGGRIISIGSCNADRLPSPNMSLYGMTKSALVGLTKGLARDLGPRGITVNVVQPGPVDTDMNPANGPRADGLRAIMAIPHYGEGEDVASLVSYLAGDESRFITGTALTIDGGYSA